MEPFELLEQAIQAAKLDYYKFKAGSAAAGARLRQSMLKVQALAQDVRLQKCRGRGDSMEDA